MNQNHEMTVSIRNLVELVLRSGDLDARFMGSSRALEGTRAHQRIQKNYKEGSMAEVTLKHSVSAGDFTLTVQGRADGILFEGETVVIDEIKTVTIPLEELTEDFNPLHWAQGKCYGYIYGLQNELSEIILQVTYYQLDTEECKCFRKAYQIDELEAFFYDLIHRYLVWADLIRKWRIRRDESIIRLDFPYPTYRKGQRELAVSVYKTIKEGKRLFAQAPTGIGKTMSALFPAIKAVGEGQTSKIFYLTAKTITRTVAEEAFEKMKQKGLLFKTLTLTAKDKICFEKGSRCSPDECQYAKGHFDRTNDAMDDIFTHEDTFTRKEIEGYARKHQICPFEFSLDLSLWADCVICDYNYVFDPRVYLKRFFGETTGDYTFLIDEAHNLVDRGRTMFSAELSKKPILDMKRKMKDEHQKIVKDLNKINSFMVKLRKNCEEQGHFVQKESPSELFPLLRRLITDAEEWLKKNEKSEAHEEFLNLYFEMLTFLRISELYDEQFITYVEKYKEDVKIKLFCLDPSQLLREAVKRGSAAVFFSATLAPIVYFREILGGDEGDTMLKLPSPFDQRNRCLLVADRISTKFKNRDGSYEEIAKHIHQVTDQKKGNYLVFFPSYQYMRAVLAIFKEVYPDITIMEQTTDMKEEEREAFLESFQADQEAVLGFAVLGGLFSEGIDLVGERLLGAIIVGVGLPQICLETDLIRAYFEEKKHMGFAYAYTYPGMNKVLQAAGRVIRTEVDRGVILLIDERFTTPGYQKLFPQEWKRFYRIKNKAEISSKLQWFWKGS
ncbi:MAG: ATP-dependent DNA helicase [Bacillota bacterium]